MIISCPSCATRYLVDSRDLGKGRTVRCARCSHSWFQKPAADDSIDDSVIRPSLTTYNPPPNHGVPSISASILKKNYLWYAAAAMLFLCVSIGLFLSFARYDAVAKWEPVAMLYEHLVRPVPAAGDGLLFSNLTLYSYPQSDNRVLLMVSGQIINNTAQTRFLPSMQVELRNKNMAASNPLKSAWYQPLPPRPVKPGESVPFYTQQIIENTAIEAITVRFIPSAG